MRGSHVSAAGRRRKSRSKPRSRSSLPGKAPRKSCSQARLRSIRSLKPWTAALSSASTGLAGLSEQLKTVYPKTGDSVYDVALKIADTRRIATEAISAMVESGLLPGQQAKAAQEQIERMEKAIPFTTNDVVEAEFAGKKTLGGATAIFSKPIFGKPATPAKTTSGATVSNW